MRLARLVLAVVLTILVVPSPSRSATYPSPPREQVEIPEITVTGKTIKVPSGGDFQAALNTAQPGDAIVLEAGATYMGPFTLPGKAGAGWVTVTTSAPKTELPQPGVRVGVVNAAAMPKLVSRSGAVVVATRGAHHYRFIGVELRPATGVFLYNLVLLGEGETSLDQLPHHIIFDRCYLHGDPQAGTRRGIAMNGAHMAVIDSYLSDFKEVGADTQAVAGWAGPGPFKIVNNYLEGAGENVMFGGADPRIQGVVPSDIEIRGNQFRKPLTWRIEDPSYAGKAWTVKNLLELKNARRVLIEGNLLEYSWGMGQVGFAVLFTVRNDGGKAPWAVVEDVTFANNVVRHAAGGVNIHGYDPEHPTQWSQRILIRNNLFEDVDGKKWKGDGRLFQLLRGPKDLVIEHNTGFADNSTIVVGGEPLSNFVFRNNIVNYGLYGIIGDSVGSGLPAINRYLPGSEIRRNVFIGDPRVQSSYPPDNSFVNWGGVGFSSGSHRLSTSSRFRGAGTDGKDIGASPELESSRASR